METRNEVQLSSGRLGQSLRDAMRYWEPRRIFYNVALAAVVIGWVMLTWPHFRGAFVLPALLNLLVLGVLANVCYCAVYLVDIPMRRSALAGAWWQRGRLGLWSAGTLFAALLANYWIVDEIYPYVH
jgi:hypothetical protein